MELRLGMVHNIIIRQQLSGGGDITFTASREEYSQLMKSNARIIFAIEYPDEMTASRELYNF